METDQFRNKFYWMTISTNSIWCSCSRTSENRHWPKSITFVHSVNSSKWHMIRIWRGAISYVDALPIIVAFGRMLFRCMWNWCHLFMVCTAYRLCLYVLVSFQFQLISSHCRLLPIWDNHQFARCGNAFDSYVGRHHLRFTGKIFSFAGRKFRIFSFSFLSLMRVTKFIAFLWWSICFLTFQFYVKMCFSIFNFDFFCVVYLGSITIDNMGYGCSL